MRISQIRRYNVQFDEGEYPIYEMPGGHEARIISFSIWTEPSGVVKIGFVGTYVDALDGGKVKPFRRGGDLGEMLKDDDELVAFLDKMPLLRKDEMSMEQFLLEESPVG